MLQTIVVPQMMSTRGRKDVGDRVGEKAHKTYQFLARDATNKTLLSLHSAKQMLEYGRVKLHGNRQETAELYTL